MEKLEIASLSPPMLRSYSAPFSLSLSSGKLERGSNVERKEVCKTVGEPCRATRLLNRRAGNKRSHAKLSQV